MLDNNEFMTTASGGPTCYCASCRDAFRRYIRPRFGDDARKRFGAGVENIGIPIFPGPLMNAWIHWRNRVWAEADETFRATLRKIDPGIILFANTQYKASGWKLATDMQYVHEDVVLAESHGLTSLGMSAKLTLGTALAHGRPLWNYIGTFREKETNRLRDPDTIARVTAPTLAHRAAPWIVYYGFALDNTADAEARQTLRHMLVFRRDHPDFFRGGVPYAPLGVLFSTRSRNFCGTPLIPACLEALLTSGIPLRGIHVRDLADTDLSSFRVLVASNCVCLSRSERQTLKAWTAGGGILVVTDDLAARDELGQRRPEAGLGAWTGSGRLATVRAPGEVAEAVLRAASGIPIFTYVGSPERACLEFRAWRNESKATAVLHVVNHGNPITVPWSLELPAGFAESATAADVFMPADGRASTRPVLRTRGSDRRRIDLPPLTVYAVIRFSRGTIKRGR